MHDDYDLDDHDDLDEDDHDYHGCQLTVTLARVVDAEDDWEGFEAWELGSGDHPTCR